MEEGGEGRERGHTRRDRAVLKIDELARLDAREHEAVRVLVELLPYPHGTPVAVELESNALDVRERAAHELRARDRHARALDGSELSTM